ncbi:MAG TPA: DUF4446 family protein [bacterium]|nr:DUF4446 family protein [bacterium]
MPAGPDTWTGLALIACAVLATAVVSAGARLRMLERRAVASGDPRILERLIAVERDLGAAARRLEQMASRVDEAVERAQRGVQHVGVVRYDAFQGAGGQLSFSLALLNGRHDGVVLSVINGRDGARAYAKPVSGGRSTLTLSEEEQRAIAQA